MRSQVTLTTYERASINKLMSSALKNFALKRVSWKHVLCDVFLLTASLYLSLWLRTGGDKLYQHLDALNQLAVAFVAVRVFTFIGFGIYRSMWRYISTRDALRLSFAIFVSVPLLITLTYFTKGIVALPRSLFFIDGFVATALLMALRLSRRMLYEAQMRPKKSDLTLGRLIIYGVGQNGRLLAQRLLNDPNRDRELLGFIDDDKAKTDKIIAGIPVLGSSEELEDILVRSGCTELVVAITNPPGELMRQLVIAGRKHKIRILRIAHFDATNIARSEAVYRPVELKDLLNRKSAEVDLPSLKSLISGRTVLVTGAGGSIGAELSRQIARLNPSKLLLLDHSEFNLYEIDRELRPNTEDFSTIVPLLTDIKDAHGLEQVFQKYKPQAVFHAAAYKHVHLVEANVPAAVLNNIRGTWNLLNLCESSNVERFVMISTDKAVNPVGCMGATKRVCELLTTYMGEKTKKPYSSVRFGNVLGSSGSLIPLLEKQILNGGPVTLTHPDMTRYFMLIPEAVSLVLMSATLSEAGDINVLKMGDPVRIQDLARNLIAMMGKTEEEIAIAYTGVRPGEKMYEELYLTGNELTTRHPDILTMPRGDGSSDGPAILTQAERLVRMAEQADPHLSKQLVQLANWNSANRVAKETNA